MNPIESAAADHPWPGVYRVPIRVESIPQVATSTATPEQIVRAMCQLKLGNYQLPPTRSVEIFYIRGIDGTAVNFNPEFLYVLDVGWGAFPGIRVPFNTVNRGALDFPNFANAMIVALASRKSKDLIYPIAAGDLLIGVAPNTSQQDVARALGNIVSNLKLAAPDLYQATVLSFHEEEIAIQVKAAAAFVRYAEPNSLVRVNDFRPGWRADRVI